jgi:hypothetical protein
MVGKTIYHFFGKKLPKNLHMSKFLCNFAHFFVCKEKKLMESEELRQLIKHGEKGGHWEVIEKEK